MFDESDAMQPSFFADSVSYVSFQSFSSTQTKVLSGQDDGLWELIYVDHGELTVSVKNRRFILFQNSFLIHTRTPGAASFTAFGEFSCAFVFIFSCTAPFLSLLSDQILSATKVDRLFFARLLMGAVSCDPLLNLHMEHLFDRLFVRSCLPVLPFVSAKKYPEQLRSFSSADARYFSVLRYLKKNLHTHLSIDRICRDNLINRSHLENLFHEKGWHGVIDCFTHMKIDAAKRMIADSNMTFSQISAALGYSSSHYFSRQFKKETNMTPTEYAFFAKEHSGDVIPSLSHYFSIASR